ncbi:MAG: peroxiredoxin family protein [Steroidobacteraceae bacterium]
MAAVLGVAGVAKLVDREGSRRAAEDFGASPAAARAASVALPACELAVAVTLLNTAAARWGAVAAGALMLMFNLAIARTMRRGERPDCHCFGQLHSASAGPAALVRNGVLAGGAAFVAIAGWQDAGASATAWVARLDTTQAVGLAGGAFLATVIAGLAWFSVALMRQNGRILDRLDALEGRRGLSVADRSSTDGAGLAVGMRAPDFQLQALDGETVTLSSLRGAAKPVLLIFSDPGCGPCNALLPEVARWQREHAARVRIALLSRGSPADNRAKREEHALRLVLLQQDREVALQYDAHGTPSAVLIASDGTISEPLARGADAIRALVSRAAHALGADVLDLVRVPGHNGNSASRTVPAMSAAAPGFELPDLDGRPLALADLRGRSALLVFWNPGCGYCRRMLDDLRRLDADPSPGSPQVVLLSYGTVDAHRDMDLRAPVLIEAPGRPVMHAYGARGTPSAVIVGPTGEIASPVAVGADGVLALAQSGEHLAGSAL